VHILGDWIGSVSIQSTAKLASIITQRLFALADTEPTLEQIHDAFRELTNMTGGNLKAVLGEKCILSVPKAVTAVGFSYEVPDAEEVTKLCFLCCDEPFVVRVHKGEIGSRSLTLTI